MNNYQLMLNKVWLLLLELSQYITFFEVEFKENWLAIHSCCHDLEQDFPFGHILCKESILIKIQSKDVENGHLFKVHYGMSHDYHEPFCFMVVKPLTTWY